MRLAKGTRELTSTLSAQRLHATVGPRLTRRPPVLLAIAAPLRRWSSLGCGARRRVWGAKPWGAAHQRAHPSSESPSRQAHPPSLIARYGQPALTSWGPRLVANQGGPEL
jgi:hypothetical protein